MKVSEIMEKRAAFSFEVFPPQTDRGMEKLCGENGVLDHLYALHPDYISCTYGAGGTNVGRNLDGLSKIKVQKALYVIEVLYDKRLVHTHFGTERLYIFLFCIEARHHLYRVARCHVHKAENHDRYADNNEDGGQQPFNNKVKHMIPTLNIALAAPARHIERVCAGAAVAFELRIRRFSAALRGADHFATRTSCKSKIAALWVNPSTLALTPTCA